MPITAQDIQLRQAGSSGLGGALVESSPTGFDAVSPSEAYAGSTEYRCYYVRNSHATLTLTGAKLWLSANTPSASTAIAVGLGTSAAGGSEQTVSSELIAPAGVTFYAAASDAAALSLGDLLPGQTRAIWERRTVTAGAAALTQDTYERTVTGETIDDGRTAATVRALWTGVPTSDGAVISSRLNSEKTAAATRVAVSTSSTLSSPTYSPALTPDSTYRITKHVLTGLQPNTEYFYAMEIDGQIDTASPGRFRTLPPAGVATNFRIAVGGCSSNANDDAFAAINALSVKPLFLLSLGDFQYMDAPTPSIGSYQGAFDVSFARPVRNLVHRQVPTVYMWDDHDFANDESTGRDSTNVAKSWRGTSTSFFRQRVPAIPASSTVSDTVHYSFVVGRVRFIISDLRADKTSQVATDNSSKTMMGAAQKAWFKSEITAAAAAGQVVAWANSVPWVQGVSSTSDAWGGYTTERTELANHIASAGMGGKVMILSSDMHALAISKGVDYATSGGAMMPVFQAGPFNKIPSSKGGPYDFGPYPAPGGATAQQYGLMDVTDDGTTVTVTWRGYSSDGTERMSYTFAATQQVVPEVPTTPTATAPAQMAAPTASAGNAQATVTIAAPSDGGSAITGYNVVSNPAGGVDGATDRLSLTRTITGLQNGTAYTFTATATNSIGTSTASPSSNSITPIAPEVPVASTFDATGGTITTPGDGYRYWTFLADGTLNVTTQGAVEYIAVGGGGPGASGNSSANGGGGAGGVLRGTLTLPTGAQSVVIGAGGTGTAGVSAAKGTSTKLGSLIEALAGGIGGYSNSPATTGGSAGGGASANVASIAGTAGQGNAGGAGFAGSSQAQRSGGGGGGAGSAGVAGAIDKGGDGGEGIDAWGRRVAGGGGGASQGAVQGVGRDGGGTGTKSGAATAGAANTGSGGGGAALNQSSGNGGSGILILRRAI